jgi:hypothetical protein
MKIWKMNDCDWVMAPTLQEAIKVMADMFCEGDISKIDEYLDEPDEISEEAYDKLKFCDLEPGEDGWDKPENKRSFREEMNRRITEGKGAEFFASNEL